MSNIKNDLKQLIIETMLPTSESYLEDLHQHYINSTITEEEKEVIKDIESFLVELENILLVIDEGKISDDKASEIYKDFSLMVNSL